MPETTSDLVNRIKASGAVTDADVLALRQAMWPDGTISEAEADDLFAINDACPNRTPYWADFSVEAVAHFLVHQTPPAGWVNDANAAWLMQRIDQEGRIDTFATLLLLVKVLESASNVPASLKSYAIAQIEAVVTSGTGPTRVGEGFDPGRINATEVGLLRRIIFAGASDGGTIISQAEAEMLFRIKDATLGQPNAPEWRTLFVQAVGNHLMAHPIYHQVDIGRAAADERFLAETHVHTGAFMSRMGQSVTHPGWSGFWKTLTSGGAADRARADAAFEASVAADRTITDAEAAELRAEMLADGKIDEMEQALLAFIARESGKLPPVLEALRAG